MAKKELAMHEKLEVHEVLLFKTACATKSTAMLELVKDSELKKLLKDDIKNSSKAIEELKEILKNAK
ncbi:spore coat protein [Metabacillus fastidiosus]|uniref:Spore coat protein n=1 Tax=Metabacillus fastidiosus TaxID=1458 RepID=A0ABU6P170_9BACI|nr:spore coat protein [Metabacillus fastidiosus]MED4402264.1 spore coat protein [Metabacillus fastidiosus]MED4454911.1 spore coat protein [Metabacillus fastidiosus]MED4462135.1 spore coat protein [Metabacillus fastidiosus]